MNRKKVLLGMSGGTDSSVAAMLLQEQGYDVTGITFRFYEIDENTAYLSEAAELAADWEYLIIFMMQGRNLRRISLLIL